VRYKSAGSAGARACAQVQFKRKGGAVEIASPEAQLQGWGAPIATHLGQAHGAAWTTEAGEDGGGNARSREGGQQREPKVAVSGYKTSAY